MKKKPLIIIATTLIALLLLPPIAYAGVVHFWWDNVYFVAGTDIDYPHPDNVYYGISPSSDWTRLGNNLYHNQINRPTSDAICIGTAIFIDIVALILGAKLGGSSTAYYVAGLATTVISTVISMAIDYYFIDERGCIWWWISWLFIDYLYKNLPYLSGINKEAALGEILAAFLCFGYFRVGMVTFNDPMGIGDPTGGIHDVAVTSVTPVLPYGATAVYPGWQVPIEVTVKNEGGWTETFEVVAFIQVIEYQLVADIGTKTVYNLAPGDSKTLSFTWNTTTSIYGVYYTVRARIPVIPSETDIADNWHPGVSLKVRKPGDANDDGVVNHDDTLILSAAYGSKYGRDPNYDWRADFNGDGEVDDNDATYVPITHDVAVTNLIVSSARVRVGESITMTAIVENQGDLPESFNVDAYYDSNPIGTQSVTNLAYGASKTLTFNWNTTGVVAGNYTIKAVASTVQGETETGDNTLKFTVEVYLVHDVAVINVTTSTNRVRAGEFLDINVIFRNEGDYSETFNVTIYYSGDGWRSDIATQNFSLSPSGTGNWTKHWFPFYLWGNYTISAKASVVPGETDTANNTYVDGTVEFWGVDDVAVTSVTPVLKYGATAVYPGWQVPIEVTVENQGDYPEVWFNVTAYYDSAAIGTRTIDWLLYPGAETTLTFNWNTTGVNYGTAGINYTISAKASVVLDETDTADNTYINGTLLVKKPGDVTGDGYVNIFDLYAIRDHLGTSYGNANYDPDADVAYGPPTTPGNNGYIDIFDLTYVQAYLGT